MSGGWVLVPRRISGLRVLHFEYFDVGASWGLMFRILGSNISEEAGFPVIGIGDLRAPPKLDFGGLASEFLVSWGRCWGFGSLIFDRICIVCAWCLGFGTSEDFRCWGFGLRGLGFRSKLHLCV